MPIESGSAPNDQLVAAVRRNLPRLPRAANHVAYHVSVTGAGVIVAGSSAERLGVRMAAGLVAAVEVMVSCRKAAQIDRGLAEVLSAANDVSAKSSSSGRLASAARQHLGRVQQDVESALTWGLVGGVMMGQLVADGGLGSCLVTGLVGAAIGVGGSRPSHRIERAVNNVIAAVPERPATGPPRAERGL